MAIRKTKMGCLFLIALLAFVCLPEMVFAASSKPAHESAQTYFHVYNAKSNAYNDADPLSTISPTGLSPTQIRKAYNLPSNGGFGTIAIIDAYDCPTVENDFVTFSNQFGLPTGNFEKHTMGPNIAVDANWSLEISLDVQWAHAIAPNSRILLVEAKSSNLGDLFAAVNYAAGRSDVVAVSMSWGTAEFPTESLYDSYFSSPNIAFFAATGDNGAGVTYPSSSPNIIAVGGTRLTFNANGTVVSETGWNGSGGGISAYEVQPLYQQNYGISGANGRRAVPDVSYNADPSVGFSVYDTTAYQGQTGWFQVGGTSACAPQWAGIHSLNLTTSNRNFYQDAKNNPPVFFRDIIAGSNGAYSAQVGYDFVTGLGSPITWNFSSNGGIDYSISVSPNTLSLKNGTLGISNLSLTSLNGYTGNVNLSATVPAGWMAQFSPLSPSLAVGGSTLSTLTISVPQSSQSGTVNVTIIGKSSILQHNTSLAVNVQTSFTGINITGFNVTSQGSGYTTPHVILNGGGGSGATATARVSQGAVIGLVLTNPGTGYTSAPSVMLKDPNPRAKGAVVTATFISNTG